VAIPNESYNVDLSGNRRTPGSVSQSANGTHNRLQTDRRFNYTGRGIASLGSDLIFGFQTSRAMVVPSARGEPEMTRMPRLEYAKGFALAFGTTQELLPLQQHLGPADHVSLCMVAPSFCSVSGERGAVGQLRLGAIERCGASFPRRRSRLPMSPRVKLDSQNSSTLTQGYSPNAAFLTAPPATLIQRPDECASTYPPKT